MKKIIAYYLRHYKVDVTLGDMMAKRIIWCLIAATLVMAFHSREGMAKEIICISPTTTSGVTIPPDWHGDLAIYAEKWTISRGEGIALWCVCGEGPLCPQYQWSVSGNGFHFDSSAGPTTGETQKQFEIIKLWADNTACGTATVTVIDDCGKTDTTYILCDEGKWANKTCIWGDCDERHCVCGNTVIGKYNYALGWRYEDRVARREVCSDPDIAWLIANDPYGLVADGTCTAYFCKPSNNTFSPYKNSLGRRSYARDETVHIKRWEWTCP
jgi:hypothetical protein